MAKETKNSTDEIKKYFDVKQAETMQYFDVKQAETMKRFDDVDKKFSSIDKKFVAIDRRFDDVDKRFVAIDKRFDKVDDKIQILFDQAFSNTEDLTMIKIDLSEIKQKLQQKTPYGEFAILEQRMDELEIKTAKSK